MLRTSNYCIYVDIPGNSQNMLLIHGYTGAYDQVSIATAKYLKSLEKKGDHKPLYGDWSSNGGVFKHPASVNGAAAVPAQVIRTLTERGYLTEKTPEEEEEFFCKVVVRVHDLARKPGYLFMPTYDCNLRCAYCFQDHLRTNPKFKSKLQVMSEGMVDRIFKAIVAIDELYGLTDSQSPRDIGFFGGEPLLASSHSTVKYIIDKAQSDRKVSFWAVTNGTDLEHYWDLVNPEKISSLQITLDGPALEHDTRRIYANGQGSFERIAQNISRALDLGVNVSVRMNIDRNNIGQLPTLADEIISRGWDRYASFNAYTAPIHAANDQTNPDMTMSSWELHKRLNKMRLDYSNMNVIERPDDSTKDSVKQIFNTQTPPQLRATFCSAHNGMHIFDSFGDIYACWEKTAESNIRIGCVTKDGGLELNDKRNELWRSRNVTMNPVCRKCRYAAYCGGGCAVLAEETNGKFFSNHCDGFAARFRHSVSEAYVDHLAQVDITA